MKVPTLLPRCLFSKIKIPHPLASHNQPNSSDNHLHVRGGERSHADTIDEPRALDGSKSRLPSALAVPSPRVVRKQLLGHPPVVRVPAAPVDGVIIGSVPESLKLWWKRNRSSVHRAIPTVPCHPPHESLPTPSHDTHQSQKKPNWLHHSEQHSFDLPQPP